MLLLNSSKSPRPRNEFSGDAAPQVATLAPKDRRTRRVVIIVLSTYEMEAWICPRGGRAKLLYV